MGCTEITMPKAPDESDRVAVNFSDRSLINNRSIPSPGIKKGWSDRGVPVGCGGRAGWDADKLEQLIRDKIRAKTQGGNGQVWEAFCLFSTDDDQSDTGGENLITPAAFKKKVGHLLNTQLSDEEVQVHHQIATSPICVEPS